MHLSCPNDILHAGDEHAKPPPCDRLFIHYIMFEMRALHLTRSTDKTN